MVKFTGAPLQTQNVSYIRMKEELSSTPQEMVEVEECHELHHPGVGDKVVEPVERCDSPLFILIVRVVKRGIFLKSLGFICSWYHVNQSVLKLFLF